MNKNKLKNYDSLDKPIKLTRRGKGVLGGLALTAVIIGGGTIAHNHLSDNESIPIDRAVLVTNGDTVDGLINSLVEHGQSHTGKVRVDVMNSPNNAETFENGQLDVGETVYLPESAE